MLRGIGPIQTVQKLVPQALIPLFIVITYLGSAWVILPGLVLLYWLWDANRITFVGSVVLTGFAITLTLKNLFALPRPPASLHLMYAAGYGFPSGHSVDATVTYGSLAMVVRVGKRWQRAVAASLLIGLVALSRVVLGVHYPIDVLVGIVLGLGTLIVATYAFDRNVLYILVSATVVAVMGVFVTHGGLEGMILLGGVVSALLGWVWKERQTVREKTDV